MHRLIIMVARILSQCLPARLIAGCYGFAVGSQDLALCLHRICFVRRSTDPYPPNTIEHEKLLAVLDLINPHHQRSGSQLTLSFDDGYLDAVEFVKKIAPNHPLIQWILFICPLKSEQRLGFRWDRFEVASSDRSQGESLLTHVTANPNPRTEATDIALKTLADLDSFKMASIQDLQDLKKIANVRLGNHGNSHLKLSSLSLVDAAQEIQSSMLDMKRIFGFFDDFAIPFGTPGKDYTAEHIKILREQGVARIWSTYSAPYQREELVAGAVLPRFIIIGTWSARRIVLYIALVCWMQRFRKKPVTEFLAFSASS